MRKIFFEIIKTSAQLAKRSFLEKGHATSWFRSGYGNDDVDGIIYEMVAFADEHYEVIESFDDFDSAKEALFSGKYTTDIRVCRIFDRGSVVNITGFYIEKREYRGDDYKSLEFFETYGMYEWLPFSKENLLKVCNKRIEYVWTKDLENIYDKESDFIVVEPPYDFEMWLENNLGNAALKKEGEDCYKVTDEESGRSEYYVVLNTYPTFCRLCW